MDTVAPGAPALVFPAENAFLNTSTPTFDWNASTGDVFGYILRVTSGDIETGPFDFEEAVPSFVTERQIPTGDALADATYQWRVIARDLAGNTAPSSIRIFTVDTVAPGAPILVQPASGDVITDNTPFFEWTPSTGDVVEYLLQVTSGGTFNPHLVVNEVIPHPGTGFQAVAPLEDRPYLWRVVARDQVLNSNSSIVQPFTVTAGLTNVEGRVLLQGRGAANNEGTEITLFRDRVQVGPPSITTFSGAFIFSLGAADYKMVFTHAGWLSDTLLFTVNGSGPLIDLGATTLLAGDADGDNDVDSRDLQLFQRGLNRAPRPGSFTDVNADGITDIVDMAYAGRNVGSRGLAPVVAPAGMVSWWPAEGDARDIVDGNDGVLQNGVTMVAGYVGQAFRFDGSNDRIEVLDAPNLGGMSQLSIDAWILPDGNGSPPVRAPGLVTKWGPGGVGDDSYLLRLTSDGRLWGAIQGSGRVDLVGNQPISDYQWALVALVYDGTELRLYVNGALDASTPAVVGPINNGTFPLLIGRNDDSQNPGTFLGLIDEVEFFNRALSGQEVSALFEARTAGKVNLPPPEPVEPPAGLISWWPGDGHAQDIIGDNDGTLLGDAGFAQGKVGQAFNFDGNGDTVRVLDSDSLDLTEDFTIDLWMNPRAFTESRVIGKHTAFVDNDGSWSWLIPS